MRWKHWILVLGTVAVCLGAVLWVVSGEEDVRETVRDRLSAPEPLSPEGYRAEFRYLREVFRQIDLDGPAVLTDGWTFNIPEAEWPFMSFCYFGYACTNLARNDLEIREEALEEVRYVIEALQTPRLAGFITPHFGQPFGKKDFTPSVFVHGHFLNVVLRYREVSGDEKYDEIIHRIAGALIKAFSEDQQGILPSYPTMWWLTDNFVAMSALARYADAFSKDISALKDKLVKSVKDLYLDEQTGLFATYIKPADHEVLQGPRGISVMYGLQFIRDFDEKFAAAQYALAKRYFIRTGLGFGAVREFPEGQEGTGDVDSGPVLLGFGPSASGFAIAAAARMGDDEVFESLLRASRWAGMPVFEEDRLRYRTMPPVGQAVILFGKTLGDVAPLLP
jgi:hypothetical protein